VNPGVAFDLAQLRYHRDQLDRLTSAVEADLADARYDLTSAVSRAKAIERAAREQLEELENQMQDDEDGSGVSWEEIAAARRYQKDCEDFADEVDGLACAARLQIDDIARDLGQRLTVSAGKLDDAIALYAAIDSHEFAGGNSAVRTQGGRSSPASGSTSSGTLLGNLPLPGGFEWVQVDLLDWDDIPPGLAFHKASQPAIEAMMHVFQDKLLPLMASNPNIGRDNLHRLDQIGGRLTPDGMGTSLSFAWDCMFGTDPIAVSRGAPGQRLGWTSGRHRAVVAQSLGWTHLPARIV
jgi:hypothetical protein